MYFLKSMHFNWRYFVFQDNFEIKRFWMNKLIYIGFFSFKLVIDLRKDWVSDMTFGKVKLIKR